MKVVWKSKKNNHKNKKYQKELQLTCNLSE